MSKEQLIDNIRQHNPTANSEFLFGFDEVALNRYLTHLRYLGRPRGAGSLWVRQPETAAVITRNRTQKGAA
jgi:hypothetical protein